VLSALDVSYTAARQDAEVHLAGSGLETRKGRTQMASLPIRDQITDHLITPENSALVVIDYQPTQFASIRSMDPALLLANVVSTVKTVKLFGLPIVHSTVNVASGQNQPTVPELAELLQASPPIDRTTINSWEDAEFVATVRATGRRKLVFCALWTEACMAFAALDALTERYEVYPVVDAIAGTSVEAHRAGLERVMHAGGKPISWVSLACELQRDWARQQTVPEFRQIVFTERLANERSRPDVVVAPR
jgi:nicotinamidase-related amidase